MQEKSFEIYKSVDIKPWCAKISDAKAIFPKLNEYLDNEDKLDFGDPIALKVYNQAVAKVLSDLDIQVPTSHLIPAVCLRFGYVKLLIDNFISPESNIIEIGTGASAIISQIAAKTFDLNCYATEINDDSFTSAQINIKRNNLTHNISLLKSEGQIIFGLVDKNHTYDAILTYPPTYGDSIQDTNKLNKLRGFKGVNTEMLGGGLTGFEFTRQYLTEACSNEYKIRYVTVLCLFKNHVNPSISILKKANREVKVIEIIAGTRKRYLVVGYYD